MVRDPRLSTLDTTQHFIDQLRERKLRLGGMVINLVNTCEVEPYSESSVFGPEDVACLESVDSSWERLRRALEEDLRHQHEASRVSAMGIDRLKSMMRGLGFVQAVQRMHEPVNDVPGLMRLNELLFANQSSSQVERNDANE